MIKLKGRIRDLYDYEDKFYHWDKFDKFDNFIYSFDPQPGGMRGAKYNLKQT